MAVMIAELSGPRTGGEFIEAKEVWHPAAGGPFGNLNNITWTGEHFTFSMLAKPTDESNSYYSFPVVGHERSRFS